MATPFDKKFNRHTTWTKKKSQWHCECKKGLWSVSGPIKEKVKTGAKRYFDQYLGEGKYDRL